MIDLRDCPMCHAAQHPDGERGPVIYSENIIDPETGDDLGAANYTVRCICCGCSVSSEYLSDAVRLWNGEADAGPNAEDEADDSEGGAA